MTWRDKLEIGLKKDAPFRKDNLFPNQVHGPEVESGPGRSPFIPAAEQDHQQDANQARSAPAEETRPVEDLPPQD
jgi:hypothetical protein